MRLVWRQEALDDRDRIMAHISEDNPEAAADLDNMFELKGGSCPTAPDFIQKGQS